MDIPIAKNYYKYRISIDPEYKAKQVEKNKINRQKRAEILKTKLIEAGESLPKRGRPSKYIKA